jgi:Rieske Fe-S protein
VKDRVFGPTAGSTRDLLPGDAAIMDVNGQRTAAYRDTDGRLHAVSAVCTHMKCDVRWNGGERSWDCPCHGSRFGIDGDVLQGPAVRTLDRRTDTDLD